LTKGILIGKNCRKITGVIFTPESENKGGWRGHISPKGKLGTWSSLTEIKSNLKKAGVIMPLGHDINDTICQTDLWRSNGSWICRTLGYPFSMIHGACVREFLAVGLRSLHFSFKRRYKIGQKWVFCSEWDVIFKNIFYLKIY